MRARLLDFLLTGRDKLTPEEWRRAPRTLGEDPQEFFVLFRGKPPEPVFDLPSGEYRYTLTVSSTGNLGRIRAGSLLAEYWSEVAGEDYWPDRSEIKDKAIALFDWSTTVAILSSIDDRWIRNDGTQIFKGLVYGPGLGGVDRDNRLVTATPDRNDQWAPERSTNPSPERKNETSNSRRNP